jgi:hypothetical protein
MSPAMKHLARRQDFYLLAVSGFCLVVFAAVAFDLYGLGGDLFHLVIEKCLARCPGLVPAVEAGLYGLQATLIFGLAFLSLRALARCCAEYLRLSSLCRALRRVDPPARLSYLLQECRLGARQASYFLSSLGVAFTVGLISPRIFLSSRLVESLTDEELRAVLRHEQKHLRRRDPLRGLVFSFFADFFFFLPAARAFLENFGKEAEFLADEHALSLSPSPHALASALVKAARANFSLANQVAGPGRGDFLIDRLNRIFKLEVNSTNNQYCSHPLHRRRGAILALALAFFISVLPAGSGLPERLHRDCPRTEQAACCRGEGPGRPHTTCLP